MLPPTWAPFLSAIALLAASAMAAPSIDATYVAQTHMLRPTDAYFGLVGNRDAHLKVHVVDPTTPASPTVTATLDLDGNTTDIVLTGPPSLPASIPDGPGVVEHSSTDSFTGTIPASWVQPGLAVTITAGSATADLGTLDVGAPTKVIMTMFDVQYFNDTNGDYPAGWDLELESKWPVAELEIRRTPHVIFHELVIPPRSGVPAARVSSKADYLAQTGITFDGEQAAALAWNGALKRAAGKSGRVSLYYINIYGVNAGGQAGGFAGVGNGTSAGILCHELGHALSLPHWGDSAAYPYKGDMFGIPAPDNYNGTHAGPAWAFDPPSQTYIPCTIQPGNPRNAPAGTYKVDPMQGGGSGHQEAPFLMNHYSDYSVNQMRNYLEGHVVVWNESLGAWARWNQSNAGYTSTYSNNGVQFPIERDVEVISILASVSGANPDVCMLYPPIGPYTTGLIQLFDPRIEADRLAAQSIFAPSNGCDVSVRLIQGGVEKIYMLAAPWEPGLDPLSSGSLKTEAINLPAADGPVTYMELLLTPDAEVNGLPTNPQVLFTWSPPLPNPASFDSAPTPAGPSSITMTATTGTLPPDLDGPIEYLFTETTGNPGGTSSGWQTSPSYTDEDLVPGVLYRYTVTMRANQRTGEASPAACAVLTGTVESDPPTLAGSDMVDDIGGASINAAYPITYLVSFSEMMDASTVTGDDFENAGTAPISNITATAVCPLSVFRVVVQPSGPGTLQLQVRSGALLLDLAGNPLNTTSPIADDTIIDVTEDITPPSLASTDIVDDRSGTPLFEYEPVNYTLSFSEPIAPGSVTAADFENGGTSPVLITGVSVTGHQVFLTLTPDYPGAAGTLQLQVKAGALITDIFDNALDTTTAIADDTALTVNAENTPPAITSINSPPAGSPILGLPTITYQVTVSEPFLDLASVSSGDFGNAGTASSLIDNVTLLSNPGEDPAVFAVDLTPTSSGTVQLRINGSISDIFGNALATPVDDDTSYTLDTSAQPGRDTINIIGFVEGIGPGGSGSKTLVSGLDASAGDKLVVIVGGEHGFSGNPGGRYSAMTYNGQPMTLAVQEESGVPTIAIFTLDHPGAAGDLIVTQDNHNGTEFAAYILNGTADGFGITTKSTTRAVDLITATPGARVIAGVLNSGPGPNGGNGAPNMSADPPLVEDTQTDLYSGSRWTSFSAGSNNIATPSHTVCSFSGSSDSYLMATVAIELHAAEITTPYFSWSTGPFANSFDNTDPEIDFDGGGLSNALEWALGGDPTTSSDDASIIPVTDNTSDAEFFIFTYRLNPQAGSDGNTSIITEYSTSLDSWINAVAGPDILVSTTPDGAGTGIDLVEVKLRRSLAADGRLFTRLKATVSP